MNATQLQEWLLRWDEGELSPQELDELSTLLARDADARKALRLHSMMTSGIHEGLTRTAATPPSLSAHRRWVLVAAAVFLIAVLVGLFLALRPEPAPLAISLPEREAAPKIAAQQPKSFPEAPPFAPAPAPAPRTVAPTPPAPTPDPRAETPPAPTPEPAPPPPPPSPKPDPKPDPKPEPKPEPGAPTVTVLARIERVSGDVLLESRGATSPARAGSEISTGQSLEIGPCGAAELLIGDLARLWVSADARVAGFSERKLSLDRGSVAVDASKDLLIVTPLADLHVSPSSYCLVWSDAESTRVSVGAGKLRVVRRSDSRAVEVFGGQTVNAVDLTVRALLRQDKKKKTKKELEFEFKVNAAITSGVAFLKAEADKATLSTNADGGFPVELVLWTLQRGGVPRSDLVFEKLFNHMMTTDLQRTYKVSLQAMILEDLDRVKYQNRIAQCAQFLVDNQCKNGQWSYGEAVPLSDPVPTVGKSKKDVATPGKADPKDKDKEKSGKPKVVQKIPIERRRDGPGQGDNSNSQYAALGLRACFDAGIVLPVEVLRRAETWWHGAQESTKKMEPAGWTYGEAASPGGRTSYGSMTAGAAGSLVIYHYLLGEPWMKDEGVLKGLEWLVSRFSVTENPGRGNPGNGEYSWHYYYLYALERFGILYGTDLLGAHDWYLEGATYLLKAQKADGSWNATPGDGFMIHDTCFAILFLRRATRPLSDVASVDRFNPK